MNYLSLFSLMCFAVVLVKCSESGHYVPKGYYVIHADGHQSPLSHISPEHQRLLHRLRRSPQFSSSSSSSSSSVSSNGGPVYFHQSTSSHVSPGGISAQGYYPGFSGQINDRFNGDDDYDDDDDDNDNDNVNVNIPYNNRPVYSTFTGAGGSGVHQTIANAHGIGSQTSGILYPSAGGGGAGGVQSQSSSVAYPLSHGVHTQQSAGVLSSNGNGVFAQSNRNGAVHTQTSGIVYPNGQVQITSHKTIK